MKASQENQLLRSTKKMLFQHNFSPKILLHQNFCVDEAVLEKVIQAGELSKEDIVFEIGAGTGILTEKLAQKAKKVIAVEKDIRLEPLLHNFPKKVEVIFSDALEILPKRKEGNKIIANIPYQVAEPLLKYLCTALHIERTVLMVPRKFAVHVAEHPFFSAFFDFKIISEVPRNAFYPQPKVVSAILLITSRKIIDDRTFLLQKLFLQKDKKLRNALREGLIALAEWKGKKLSKKEANRKIDGLELAEEVMDELVMRVKLNKVKEITDKLMGEL